MFAAVSELSGIGIVRVSLKKKGYPHVIWFLVLKRVTLLGATIIDFFSFLLYCHFQIRFCRLSDRSQCEFNLILASCHKSN